MAFESLHLLRLSDFPATGLSVNPPVRLCSWLVIKKLLSFILVEPIIVIIKVVSRCRLLGCSGLREIGEFLSVSLPRLKVLLTAGVTHSECKYYESRLAGGIYRCCLSKYETTIRSLFSGVLYLL